MTDFFKTPKVIAAMLSAAVIISAGCASTHNNPYGHADKESAQAAKSNTGNTYSENDLVDGISRHLGVTSESAASVIERLFRDRGRPVGYITGEEGSGGVGWWTKIISHASPWYSARRRG